MMVTVDLMKTVVDESVVNLITGSSGKLGGAFWTALLAVREDKQFPIPCAMLVLKKDGDTVKRVEGTGLLTHSHLAAMKVWADAKSAGLDHSTELLMVAVANADWDAPSGTTRYLVLGFGNGTASGGLPSAATWKGLAISHSSLSSDFNEAGQTEMRISPIAAGSRAEFDAGTLIAGRQEGGNGGGGGDANGGAFKVGSLLSVSGLTAWKVDTYNETPDPLPHLLPDGTALATINSGMAPNLAVVFLQSADAVQFTKSPAVQSLCHDKVCVIELKVV